MYVFERALCTLEIWYVCYASMLGGDFVVPVCKDAICFVFELQSTVLYRVVPGESSDV